MRLELRGIPADNDTLSLPLAWDGTPEDLFRKLSVAYRSVELCAVELRGICDDNACRSDHALIHIDMDKLRVAINPDDARF